MKRITLINVLVLVAVFQTLAAGQSSSRLHDAIDVPKTEIDAILGKLRQSNGTDVSVGEPIDVGPYILGIGALRRAPGGDPARGRGGILHDETTEVYYMLTGSGMQITGGMLIDSKLGSAQSSMGSILGPTRSSARPIKNGYSRKLTAGDLLVIPPGVPHGWDSGSRYLEHLAVRIRDKAPRAEWYPKAAIDVPSDEIQATVDGNRSDQSSVLPDFPLRLIDYGKFTVGIAIARRQPTGDATQPSSGISLDQTTEVYYILSGSGTLVTGGTKSGGKPRLAPPAIGIGPGTIDLALSSARSRIVGPGDITIIPPGVGHTWSRTSPEGVDYLVVRVTEKEPIVIGSR